MDCKKYDYKFIDIFIIPFDIFRKLCTIEDIRNMFLIGILRLIFYLVLSYYLINFNNKYMKINNLNNCIYIYAILHIILFLVILMKKPLYYNMNIDNKEECKQIIINNYNNDNIITNADSNIMI
jgi:hypothetical protein